MLDSYYEQNSEKIPDVMLIVPKEINMYESWKYSSHGAGVHEEETPVFKGFLKTVTEGAYTYKEYKGTVLYKRP